MLMLRESSPLLTLHVIQWVIQLDQKLLSLSGLAKSYQLTNQNLTQLTETWWPKLGI